MKISILNNILKTGIKPSHTAIEQRRIQLLNFMIVFSAVVLAVLFIININVGYYNMALIDLSAFLFSAIPVLLLNHYGRYKVAASYFIIISIIITCYGCFLAYSEGRFTETENILILMGIMAIIMIDSHYQFILYVFSSISLLLMKYLKLGVFSDASFNDILMMQVNTLTVIIAAYFLLRVFKNMLTKAIQSSESQEAILYSLIDNTPLHLGLIDRDWKFLIMNNYHERIFKLTRKDIIGKHVSDVLPDWLFNRHKPLIEKAFLGESPEFTEQSKLPSGEDFYLQGKYAPLLGAQGEINGVTVYVTNISRIKQVEAKLQKALKNKDKLFSIIAHDIISPLNLFQNILAINDDELMDKKSFFDYQNTVKGKLLILNNTISNLLQWARTQQNGLNAYPKGVEIKTIVDENLLLFEDLSFKKGLQISQSLDGSYAYIDEDHLKLMVRNIIHNSIKFSRENGTINITSRLNDGYIHLCIQDFGVGISEEKIEKIFDKTIHFSEAGTAGEMGTGLGLSLCVELAKLNECGFNISSIPNQETIFEIKIPAFKPELDNV
ncbi:MAG: PAS domain-containing sensor histidine kinase [Cyclobacteriaceae bacterium]